MANSKRTAAGALTASALALGLGLAFASHGMGQPAPPAAPAASASLVARGRYLATAGDCVDCHTKPGGPAFAGGRAIPTPFGTLESANLTPGGIGDWTPDQFYRALHTGVDDEGKHLYPAFPYTYYTRVHRADSDAILAYLKTLPAVLGPEPRNSLPFPLNIRALVGIWNALYLRKGELGSDPQHTPEWNRGAYLVEGLGHCGACHTPKDMLGGDLTTRRYRGGVLDNWAAADLTGDPRRGLGSWTVADIVEYLKTGRNAHSAATGPMGEVVAYSTSQLNDADLQAMAVYLKSFAGSPATPPAAPAPADLRAGEAIFVDQCSACHKADGSGEPRFSPPLPADANAQQAEPATLVRIILEGARTVPTAARPTPLAMPAYGWKLDDAEVAAVATYVRNSWGNRAPPVTVGAVAKLRRRLPPPSRGATG